MARIGLFLTVIAVALLTAAPAHAKVVYVKGVNAARIYVAEDDGTGARRLVAGFAPSISPNGRWVAYLRSSRTRLEVRLTRSTGGASRLIGLASSLNGLEFSPDSSQLAVGLGNRLVAHDIPDRSTIELARASTRGLSFSPDSRAIVYAKAAGSDYNAPSDLYTRALDAERPVRITFDRRSRNPLWTAQGIVFNQQTDRGSTDDPTPLYELFEVQPDGSGVRRITDHAVLIKPLTNGLAPLARSPDGTRLLAIETGESPVDPAYAVDMTTGAARELLPSSAPAEPHGFSRDGTTVLLVSGSADPTDKHDVFTVPWEGGSTTLIARNAYAAAWSR